MKRFIVFALMLWATMTAVAEEEKFCIAKDGKTATIVVDESDWKGVLRAANDLGDDVRKVTGVASPVVSGSATDKGCILVGTIGKSRIIDRLIKQKKLDVKIIKGRWEAYKICVVDGRSADGRLQGKNLVIAGSDKRGTIYGIYEL